MLFSRRSMLWACTLVFVVFSTACRPSEVPDQYKVCKFTTTAQLESALIDSKTCRFVELHKMHEDDLTLVTQFPKTQLLVLVGLKFDQSNGCEELAKRGSVVKIEIHDCESFSDADLVSLARSTTLETISISGNHSLTEEGLKAASKRNSKMDIVFQEDSTAVR